MASSKEEKKSGRERVLTIWEAEQKASEFVDELLKLVGEDNQKNRAELLSLAMMHIARKYLIVPAQQESEEKVATKAVPEEGKV